MKNYKIGVLGLSETRWLQTGQLRFSSGEQLLYSGHTEDGAPHTEGVALMLAPEAQRALIGWEPVNSRIITAKFITKKKDIKLNIIQCYAPTNDAEEEKKDDFYQQLQTVIDRGGAKDMTILMGDFNAKIGSDNTGYENTMGTHGLGQMNENGERFADFCALNQLVIGGSIFPHKRIHKATWRSPDHVTENQIDHICISRKFRRSWRDVRVMRGADAKAQEEYTAADREVKRSTRKDKRDYIDDLANQAEEAAGQGNLKDLYQVTKKLVGKFQQDRQTSEGQERAPTDNN
nr:hypothetical protein BaRGS_008693 [Batillaria attramentaria]